MNNKFYLVAEDVPKWMRIIIIAFATPFFISLLISGITLFAMLFFCYPVVLLIGEIKANGFINVPQIISVYVPTLILALFCWIAEGDIVMPMIDDMIVWMFAQLSIAFCIGAVFGLY